MPKYEHSQASAGSVGSQKSGEMCRQAGPRPSTGCSSEGTLFRPKAYRGSFPPRIKKERPLKESETCDSRMDEDREYSWGFFVSSLFQLRYDIHSRKYTYTFISWYFHMKWTPEWNKYRSRKRTISAPQKSSPCPRVSCPLRISDFLNSNTMDSLHVIWTWMELYSMDSWV